MSGDYMADVSLGNALFEAKAIANKELTLRMVMASIMAVPKIAKRVSLDDIRQLHEALQANMATLPHYMTVLIEGDKRHKATDTSFYRDETMEQAN